MRNFRLTIAYDGTRYQGWQSQGNTDRTIQGKLQAVFSKLARQETEVHGAGRTDAGVHAKGQVANVKLNTNLTCQELKDYCNRYLPEDIGILDIAEAHERFHARLNAKAKCYVYRIWNSTEPCIFERRYVTRIPQPLDISAIEQAAEYLTGTHDFRSFCGLRRFKRSTVRTIYSIDVQRIENELRISFVGNGFLNLMVRILTGTLVEVGLGKRLPKEIPAVLDALNRDSAGPTMPPTGLCLEYVTY